MPRLAYQFAKACRGGHLKDFIRAMKSASKLLPACLDNRQPLRPETLQRIGELKRGLVP